jgi:hypothetical protein
MIGAAIEPVLWASYTLERSNADVPLTDSDSNSSMGTLRESMPVKTREALAVSARYREKRRGHRMNSRVPVRLEWDDAKGRRVRVEAHTRVVNPYGCMVVLEHDLNLEHRLALTNVATDTSNSAVIVWKGNQRPEGGWEYGVELVAPEMDFWGLEL